MSHKRRIQPFSQRDRVLYALVPKGTPFLWRGARWIKLDQGCARLLPNRTRMSCTDPMADMVRARGAVIPFPKSRVTVSRASGVAQKTWAARTT